MRYLLAIVRYAPLPAFLFLAGINYHLESMGAGHHSRPAESTTPMMHEAALTQMASPMLGTMWLMYLLMALAHAGPWLSRGKFSQ